MESKNFPGEIDPGENDPGIEERAVLAALASVQGFGAVDFGVLLSKVTNIEEVWQMEKRELESLGLRPLMVKRLIERRKQIDPIDYLGWLQERGVGVVSIFEDGYPSNLKQMDLAPYVLFVKGGILREDELAVAVVGTRKPSEYGRAVVCELVEGLAAMGVCIVSGLAYGVDRLAHQAALKVGGRTLAVLGQGIDQVAPRANQELAREIEKSGALVSEFAWGMPALKQNFVARNRLVSGLSLGVLVIEGAVKSGTLITANFCKQQQRYLWAVPGSIFNPMSFAPNSLIKEGAKVVTNVDDVLSLVKGVKEKKTMALKTVELEGEEAKVFELVGEEGEYIDVLVANSGMSSAEFGAVLMVLELKGLVLNEGGKVRRV